METSPILMLPAKDLQAAKLVVMRWLEAPQRGSQLASELVAADAEWHCSHPVNVLPGIDAVVAGWVEPLSAAFKGLQRRTDIFMAGGFDGRFCGGEGIWVAAIGHYVGIFEHLLWGIHPHGRTAFLRFGEFYRVLGGQIVEARILVDLVDLLRQTGVNVLPQSPGVDILVPGPADHSGLLIQAQAEAITQATIERVMAMFYALARFDRKNLDTMGMHEHWSENMMWYGPCGIGTARRVSGFQDHHQRPFLHAFPDRVGGNHRARIAEGRYMASTGWPSVRATHAGDYLGAAATHKPIAMRVMDWWRVTNTTIVENWVRIDLPALLLQMGVDVLARARR